MRTLVVALAFVSLSIAPHASAQVPARVTVIVFPGGFNWPLWVAQEQGLFSAERLEVTLTPTPSSSVQLTSLLSGTSQIAMTAVDNVVACREGQIDTIKETDCDLFAFMGGDSGLLRLVVRPEIRSIADLRHKELSVDSLTTGYAFVLRTILEQGGLAEGDYTLVPAGGVAQRWDALRAGTHAGTLLLTPFEFMAEAAGFRRLANATQILGHYQGLVGAARRSWATANSDVLVRFIRAYRAGLAWLFDPRHRHKAVALLQKSVPGMSAALAAQASGVLLGPTDGFEPAARLDVDGLRTVLALRSRHARPARMLGEPARYFDLSYYERAGNAR